MRSAWTSQEMRMLGFQTGRGMRLDLALVNPWPGRAGRRRLVGRDAHRGPGPSDDAPLVLDLADS